MALDLGGNESVAWEGGYYVWGEGHEGEGGNAI